MNASEFKSGVNSCLLQKGFQKKGNCYYKKTDEIIHVVCLQKSNFSNAFYINLGIVVRQLHSNEEHPREVDADIRTRFGHEYEGEIIDLFDLDTIAGRQHLISSIENNIREFIETSLSERDLMKLIRNKPALQYLTTGKAKKYLEELKS